MKNDPIVAEGANDCLRSRRIQIGVRNFGPIARGLVDLRPLTVFVGPSNTGKTYLSILAYALHRSLGGFQRLPLSHQSVNFPGDLIGYRPGQDVRGSESLEALDQLRCDLLRVIDQTAVKYSDLPATVRSNMEAVLRDPDRLGSDVVLELKRCLDARATSDFIRTSAGRQGANISLRVSEGGQELWHCAISLTDDRVTASGDIKDMELIGKDAPSDDSKRVEFLRSQRQSPTVVFGTDFLAMVTATDDREGTMHYLPAARAGIMQSYRVIAGSLIARSTTGRPDRVAHVPSLSGVVADFMQRIALYSPEDAEDPALQELASELEEETLTGQIGARTLPGGYSDFAYRPLGTEQDIRLTRASSMVSELAPVVVFMRGVIRIGDTLIIEEPEAHLHPAAQTRMAVTLARLVRAGVRVLVTTHSDWLLKEIANLMREGALAEQAGTRKRESTLPSMLHPDEVGVWLFRQDRAGQGSTVQEIPFDRSEGVEPPDYDDVAEQLYDRAADLQDRLEESRRDV